MDRQSIDLGKIQEDLLNLLPRAGQILRRYFHSEDLESKKKGTIDVVTAADLAVDKFLIANLPQICGEIPILTEETAKEDYLKYKDELLMWVVDPLDGTANFARGDANFSISVALVSLGKPLVGCLFLPVSGRLFWARENKKGAFWNGRRIHVSVIDELSKSTVCTDWSHILTTRDETTHFLKKIFGTVRQIKILGSAATDISLLARGGVDIYHHVHLLPWDVAASAFIAEKAGAKVTDKLGAAWDVFTPSILAANPVLHSSILERLRS